MAGRQSRLHCTRPMIICLYGAVTGNGSHLHLTGNFDVYVMPSSGGEAKRLTFYSGSDLPWDFSPDGKTVLFSSNRIDLSSNAQISGAGMNELYSVPVNGGRATLVITQPAMNARYNSSGDKIIFHDYKIGRAHV